MKVGEQSLENWGRKLICKVALLCLDGPGSEFSRCGNISRKLNPIGQDFSFVFTWKHSRMINIQKIYWRASQGQCLWGRKGAEDWAEGEAELQGSLSDSLS